MFLLLNFYNSAFKTVELLYYTTIYTKNTWFFKKTIETLLTSSLSGNHDHIIPMIMIIYIQFLYHIYLGNIGLLHGTL